MKMYYILGLFVWRGTRRGNGSWLVRCARIREKRMKEIMHHLPARPHSFFITFESHSPQHMLSKLQCERILHEIYENQKMVMDLYMYMHCALGSVARNMFENEEFDSMSGVKHYYKTAVLT